MAILEEDRKLAVDPPSQQDYLHNLLNLASPAKFFQTDAARTPSTLPPIGARVR